MSDTDQLDNPVNLDDENIEKMESVEKPRQGTCFTMSNYIADAPFSSRMPLLLGFGSGSGAIALAVPIRYK